MPLPDIEGDWPRCATEYFPPFLPVQAEDYDTRIAGPRREERLRRMEEQMRSIRGFRGEGQTLRSEEPASSSLGQRQLRDPVADSQRQLDNRHHVTADSSGVASHGDHVTEKDESGDSHVTERSEEEGRVVTLGLRLRDRTVRKQFYTTDTVQVMYSMTCWSSLMSFCACQLSILHV